MSQPPMLDPVHHTATYELVVDQIRRVIYLGRYLPGDKLPPERELSQQLGVSRTTVREAIRMLEGENLIRVKRGAQGGIVVMSQGIESGSERVALTGEQEKALRDVFEFRLAVECKAVHLAAERRTEADVEVLSTAVAEMDALLEDGRASRLSVAAFNASDNRFHIRIAEASGNPFLRRAVEETRAAMFLPIGAIFDRLSETANLHHRPILEAIVAADGEAAAELMRQHVSLGLDGLKRTLGKDGADAAQPRSEQ